MSKKIFVSPFDGGWKVKTVGAGRAAGIFDTKAEAVDRAYSNCQKPKRQVVCPKTHR